MVLVIDSSIGSPLWQLDVECAFVRNAYVLVQLLHSIDFSVKNVLHFFLFTDCGETSCLPTPSDSPVHFKEETVPKDT